jgi:hypothetical protein
MCQVCQFNLQPIFSEGPQKCNDLFRGVAGY